MTKTMSVLLNEIYKKRDTKSEPIKDNDPEVQVIIKNDVVY